MLTVVMQLQPGDVIGTHRRALAVVYDEPRFTRRGTGIVTLLFTEPPRTECREYLYPLHATLAVREENPGV